MSISIHLNLYYFVIICHYFPVPLFASLLDHDPPDLSKINRYYHAPNPIACCLLPIAHSNSVSVQPKFKSHTHSSHSIYDTLVDCKLYGRKIFSRTSSLFHHLYIIVSTLPAQNVFILLSLNRLLLVVICILCSTPFQHIKARHFRLRQPYCSFIIFNCILAPTPFGHHRVPILPSIPPTIYSDDSNQIKSIRLDFNLNPFKFCPILDAIECHNSHSIPSWMSSSVHNSPFFPPISDTIHPKYDVLKWTPCSLFCNRLTRLLEISLG